MGEPIENSESVGRQNKNNIIESDESGKTNKQIKLIFILLYKTRKLQTLIK